MYIKNYIYIHTYVLTYIHAFVLYKYNVYMFHTNMQL